LHPNLNCHPSLLQTSATATLANPHNRLHLSDSSPASASRNGIRKHKGFPIEDCAVSIPGQGPSRGHEVGSCPYDQNDPRWQSGPSQRGPHTFHCPAGPYYPPPAPPRYPPYSAPPGTGSHPPDYRVKQKVSVRIAANTWVLGIVTSIVYIYSALTGGTYTVEFDSVDGSGRRETRDFSDEELRPCQPGR